MSVCVRMRARAYTRFLCMNEEMGCSLGCPHSPFNQK